MQPAAGSKRRRAQAVEREHDAAVTSGATGGGDERAAQRLRLEGETRAAQPAVARGSAAQSAAAAASASSDRVRPQRASRSTARAESLSIDAGDAAAAVNRLADQTDRTELQAAATVGRPAISPAQRCDPDSLSLIYAHLGTANFLAAIRVCRQWSSARMKHSAWPQLHLPSFIQSLRNDDYGNSDRRRLKITVNPLRPSPLAALLAPPKLAAAGSAAAAAGSMWRHVTDAKLEMSDGASRHGPQKQMAWESSLQQLAQLPNLSVLNLQECTAGDAAVAAFYGAVAARLQALILFRGSDALTLHLPLLSNLRVLVLDRTPEPAQLLPLHQLQYLHLATSGWTTQTIYAQAEALRWLSSEQSLRSLSVNGFVANPGAWEPLFRAPVQPPGQSAEAQPVAAAASQSPSASSSSTVIDWTKPCSLTDVSMARMLSGQLLTSICALPQLTRLQCQSCGLRTGSQFSAVAAQKPQPEEALAKLRQLRLNWQDDPGGEGTVVQLGWRHLQRCSQLRVLELSASSIFGPLAMLSAQELQRTLAACSETLEETVEAGWAAGAEATASRASLETLDETIRLDRSDAAAEAVAAAQTSAHPASAAAAVSPPQPHSQVPNGWGALAQCTRLRVLEMALQPNTAHSGMMQALSLLPVFQSLGLTVSRHPAERREQRWPAHGFKLPKTSLQYIVRSRSWCSLHLHRRADVLPVNLLSRGGLAEQLPPLHVDDATASRLRVYDHRAGSAKVRSYAIRADERGVKTWQQA